MQERYKDKKFKLISEIINEPIPFYKKERNIDGPNTIDASKFTSQSDQSTPRNSPIRTKKPVEEEDYPTEKNLFEFIINNNLHLMNFKSNSMIQRDHSS